MGLAKLGRPTKQDFDDYISCGTSGICDDVLLKGRPYGGVLFLYKKSISPYIEVCELDSNRACCIRLSASIGYIYILNVYMPCDSSTNSNLEEYNEVLSVISNYCATHNAENCIIGGDLNTDMSKSGNSISLQNFMDKEILFSVFKETINNVAYTYKGANNATSLIAHFIVSEDVTIIIIINSLLQTNVHIHVKK